MRISAAGTLSIVDPVGHPPESVPVVRHGAEPAVGGWAECPGARAVRPGGPAPDVVLVGTEQEAALAVAVAELLDRDGLAAVVVALTPAPRAADPRTGRSSRVDPDPRADLDAVAPPGVPRVAICGECPETPEGIRLAAHDAVAAGTLGR